MQGSRGPRPQLILVRDLLLAALLAAFVYIVFNVLNGRLLYAFSGTEVLLLEGGAVVAVAYLIARAIGNATNAFLERAGLRARGSAVRLFLNLLVAIGTVLAVFRLAGVSAESVLLGAGLAGIVLGLASQTVLSNVFAGILLVFSDPFRPGDRVGFVTSSYGVFASSYPHEVGVPSYTGTVEDVGLIYTVVALDTGGLAKLPNGVVITSLVLLPRGAVLHRVRMTFPRSVSVASVEAVLPGVAQTLAAPFPGAPGPRLELADLSPTTWDGVVVLWSTEREPGEVRDRVLRAVLAEGARAPDP
jgi:small-conductance mechanosensitive channel